MKITNAKLKRRLSIDRAIHYFECSRSVHDKPCFDALWIYVWSGKLGGNVVNWQRQTTHIQQRHIIGTKCCITSWINGPIKEQSEVNPALLVYYLLTNIVLCLRDYVSVYVSEGFKGGTRGAPIRPRDAVSRAANVERTGRHKWDILCNIKLGGPRQKGGDMVNFPLLYNVQERTLLLARFGGLVGCEVHDNGIISCFYCP